MEKVESGDVLAALILPEDLINKINSLSTLSPGTPKVEVLVNESDPLKASVVDDKITRCSPRRTWRSPNGSRSKAARYLNLVIKGGDLPVLGGGDPHPRAARRAPTSSKRSNRRCRPGRCGWRSRQVTEFANEAGENLDIAGPLIERLAQPIEVEKVAVGGSSPPLETFAIAVAATLTLAFVTVLLVAGSLALEREENAFPRLTRGLVSSEALLGEKVLLGVVVGLVVTLLMLAGLTIFVPLEWGRFGLWLAAIVVGGAALAAAGAALGAAAREVRAVSLLAFMVTLPVAFLSLVPSGTVGNGPLRRDQGDHRALPVQAGAGSDDLGARSRQRRHRRAAAAPGDPDRRLRA